jgi:ribosomal protein S18 acetylase RimI-like enzyme
MQIRPFAPDDAAAVVELSLWAWEPVFASLRDALGAELDDAMHGDWREYQRRSVQQTCETNEHIWVAEVQGTIAGFVAVVVHDPTLGEIYMIAVDPAHQRAGIGSALTEFALTWIKDQGAAVAMVETGGDPGHAPARATYVKAGFTALPVVRYFKKL